MEDLKDEDDAAYNTNATAFNGSMDRHEIIQYYSEWAYQYEEDLAPGRYDGPMMTAETCAQYFKKKDRQNVRILDVAAGTGLVGELLAKKGFSDIHALDPSEGMLELAKRKQVYKTFLNEYLTEDKLPVPDSGYVVIAMREEYLYNVPEYKDRLEPLMAKLEAQGKWVNVERRVVPNYAFKKNGLIFIYKVL
ncbi:Williams-Beuren syndrome chromosomal region 27 protein-like isoform X2 [Mizuhopecten yessoensis]|uniref:Williams-Beuren syndrome chromosomal region 27 protein-like isoform X2 n=1 Tax=Mizuhopecten yessoensis TaxID=6573 RepID=UPI000B45C478|nr:Williams-Beuren syndrome chromosomal region 27 protein-like isoform X2 [Mizuhopecten yessoensis]